MRKTLILVAAATAALAATIGMAQDKHQFVHDGSTYVYTASVEDGRQVIDGRRYPSGQAFHLVVRGDAVGGTSGGIPVAFKVAEATGAAGNGIETAAR